jgi:hypothetical protein
VSLHVALGDSRLSLEERYPSHAEYVEADHLLREEDAAADVKKAQDVPVGK